MSKKIIFLTLSLLTALVLFAACSRPTNVREFFDANADEFQELVDEMNAEAAAMSAAFGIDISINLEIRGNDTLVYNFVYGPDTQFDPGVEAELEAQIALMADFQTEMAQEMRNAMRIDTLYILVRYLDSNGRVLAEGTFSGH